MEGSRIRRRNFCAPDIEGALCRLSRKCVFSISVSGINILIMADTHTGGCYCGAVEVQATGEPVDMGYCHCNECRRYCTAPVSIFTLWIPEAVSIRERDRELRKLT